MAEQQDKARQEFVRIATYRMPFGKHCGQRVIDLPESYLIWFARKGFPQGKLGEIMQAVLEIKTNGLERLFKPVQPVAGEDMPADRRRLLNAAKWFVDRASLLVEVVAVDLDGALCTPVDDPRTVSLIVAVHPAAPLTGIAALARQLQGKLGAARLDAPVFLVEAGRCIGRACCVSEPRPRPCCSHMGSRCVVDRPLLCEVPTQACPSRTTLAHPALSVYPQVQKRGIVPDDVAKAFGIDGALREDLF